MAAATMVAYYAHSGREPDLSDGQRLKKHLLAVALGAASKAALFGAANAAHLAGLLHDLGKYTLRFLARLQGGPRVDHARAGALVVRSLPDAEPRMRSLLAYVIAGHHAGLHDAHELRRWLDDDACLTPDPVWRQEIEPDGHALLPLSVGPKAPGFQLAFLGRMIFSCLIDADRSDTAGFDRAVHGVAPPDPWPTLAALVDTLRDRLSARLAGFKQDRDIDRLRRSILDHARAKAALDPGFFTLTVPTGGGKTLTSLAFALDHAKTHRLERIVYSIPFTSILEQTVDEFERTLGEDVVLAHHSGFEMEDRVKEEMLATCETTRAQLAMEDWAAPLVVTTNVQLFESLFSHRPSRCRKLQSLARSVVVLDEAQTIPLHVLRPCLAALNELVLHYGCSVVLCTATQPAVLAPRFKNDGLLIGDGRHVERELAPDPPALHRRLARVTVRFADTMTDGDLIAALDPAPQALVIVNTRRHALELYEAARDALTPGSVIHLTTRHYAADRRRILAEVRRRLLAKEPCRLIATSLVEAGVDLDFPVGWRAEAGLDSIAQAAGRVNREGGRSRDTSILTVFTPAEAKPPPEIEGFIADRKRVVQAWDGCFSPEAVEAYFSEVYWRVGARLDATPTADGPLEVLHPTTFGVSGGACSLRYRTVGENFRLIRSGLVPVIVAREEQARDALDRLERDRRAGAAARALQPFVVEVPPKARARLLAAKAASFKRPDLFGDQFCVLDNTDLYKAETGLLWDDPAYLATESLIG